MEAPSAAAPPKQDQHESEERIALRVVSALKPWLSRQLSEQFKHLKTSLLSKLAATHPKDPNVDVDDAPKCSVR
jgi:hypothetical protein